MAWLLSLSRGNSSVPGSWLSRRSESGCGLPQPHRCLLPDHRRAGTERIGR